MERRNENLILRLSWSAENYLEESLQYKAIVHMMDIFIYFIIYGGKDLYAFIFPFVHSSGWFFGGN